MTEKVYDDSDPDDIEKSLPETTPHRHIDLSIVRADQAGTPLQGSLYLVLTRFSGYLLAYIVLPGTIWGVAKNSLVDAGIINPHSIGIRLFFGAAFARGRTGVIGKGLAVWPAVEIEDRMCAALFLSRILIYSPSDGPLCYPIRLRDQESRKGWPWSRRLLLRNRQRLRIFDVSIRISNWRGDGRSRRAQRKRAHHLCARGACEVLRF